MQLRCRLQLSLLKLRLRGCRYRTVNAVKKVFDLFVCNNCLPIHQGDLIMIRHRASLEILACDLESRYGKDDPLVREVRTGIPTEINPRLSALMSGVSTQKPFSPLPTTRQEPNRSGGVQASPPLL
jgi:hypothetical protein